MKDGQVLRLYFDSNWPHEDSVCPWALLSRDRAVIERGHGTARDWPAADECEAVVSADQVSWLSVDLPQKLGRDASQIVAYALEDKLLEHPEAMHVVAVRSAGGATASAIAIRRTRLQEILDVMSGAGRRLDRLVTELQLAPPPMGQWLLCRFGATAFLRAGSRPGLAVDWTGTSPPDLLMLAIARACARGELPERLVIAVPPGQIPDLDVWSSTLGVAVTAGGSFDPLLSPIEGASNLLTDSYSPQGKSGFPRHRYLRLSVIALILAGIAHTVLSLADWAWLAYRAASLRTEATTLYREAFPDSTAPLLNPGLQLQREATIVLRERGHAGGDDMLTMLALLMREFPPTTLARRVHFDHSTLEIVAVLPGDSVRRIDSAVRLHGYAIQATAMRQEAAGTEYKIRMYPR